MAILKVSNELVDNPEAFGFIKEAFDSMVEIGADEYAHCKIFRVQKEEVPKEDVLIDPLFMHFYGVKPFVIDYGV